jgi:ribonuclease HI
MWHLIVCDGGKKSLVAYGSFAIYDDTGIVVNEQSFIIGPGTSNQSEYIAMINALTWCINHGILYVVVLSDSLLMVNQILRKWECYDENLRILLKKSRKLIKEFKGFKIKHISRKYIVQKLGH